MNVPGIWKGRLENITVGTSVRHITANKGHWRIPFNFVNNPAHAQFQARHYLFAKCPYPKRCLGEPEMSNYECHLLGDRGANASANVSNSSSGLGPSSSPSFTGSDWSASCAPGTHPEAAACGQCAPKHTASSGGLCRPCEEAGAGLAWTILILMLLVFGIFVSQKHRCKKSLEKLRLVWPDLLKLVTILVTYQQVSSSVPTVVAVEWPSFYLDFLPFLSIFNLDFAVFLSFDCVFGANYIETLYIYTFLPVMVLMLAILNYQLVHMRLLKNLKKAQKNYRKLNTMWEKGLARAFDLIDDDDTGHLNLEEMAELLVAVNSVASDDVARGSKKARYSKAKKSSFKQRCLKRFQKNKEKNHGFRFLNQARTLIKEYGEWDSNNNMVIYRTVFLENAKKDDRMAGKTIPQKRALILFSQSANLIRSTYGTAFQIIFVMHAPLSVPAFKFFDCRNFGERSFLHSDYTLDCAGEKYEFGRRFALSVITLFGFGLPVFFGGYILINRKFLHTAHLEAKVGWMYANYRHGAEGWEIFQISRKIFLTGVLYLLGRQTFIKIMFGIICALLTLVSLVEMQPFNSRQVFLVAVASGTCTCLKFAMSFLLMIPEAVTLFTFTWDGTDADRGNGIGLIMMIIDLVAFGCTGAVFVRLFRKAKRVLALKQSQTKDQTVEKQRQQHRLRRFNTENQTTNNSGTKKRAQVSLKRTISIAHDHDKLHKMRDAHENSIQLRRDKIAKANTNASRRLRLRLKKRETLRGSSKSGVAYRSGGGSKSAVNSAARADQPVDHSSRGLAKRPVSKAQQSGKSVLPVTLLNFAAFAKPLPKDEMAGRTAVLPVSLENVDIKDAAGTGSADADTGPLTSNVLEKNKSEAIEKKKEDGKDNLGLRGLLFEDVNDEVEVQETRTKLKKQIRKAKQFYKISRGLFVKFKISSFTVAAFAVFLKLGLRRKQINDSFVSKIWEAVAAAELSPKRISADNMPAEALEHWIFTFTKE
jgi:hypothetical protein